MAKHNASAYKNKKNRGKEKELTWQGLFWMRFCSENIFVPPVTTWAPMVGWYLSSLVASTATWRASSRVGHTTRTRIGVWFWPGSLGVDFTTTSIDESWIIKILQK